MDNRGLVIQYCRFIAAAWLRDARSKPYSMSPWDTCVVAATNARQAGDIGAYDQIRAVAVRFKPSANVFLGDLE